jgi:cytochrome b561
MGLRNTDNTYGRLTIAMHWLIAILIIGLLAVGFMVDLLGKGATKNLVIELHKATGLLVLLIGLFRWYWTITSKSPRPLDTMSKAEIGISHAVKWLLMLAMIGMPLSGVFMSMYAGHGVNIYGLFDIPALVEKNKDFGGIFHELHELGGFALAGLVGLHIVAAIKHHYVTKDETLNRMLGK